MYICNTNFNSPEVAINTNANFYSLLRYNTRNRNREWRALMKKVKQNSSGTLGTVIGGCLNTPDFDPLYRKIRKEYVDVHAYVGLGRGLTYKGKDKRQPYMRFDYILINGKIEPLSSKVLAQTGADHLPVFAKVRL